MIQVSRWSLFYAIILGSVLLLLFHFGICNRKKTIKDAITPYITLLLLIFIRVIFPVDSDAFYVIRSTKLLNAVHDLLMITLLYDLSIEKVLVLTWIIGAIVSLFIWNCSIKKDVQKTKIIKECASSLSEKQLSIATKAGLNANCVFVTDKIDEVVTVGIREYMILLPQTDYSDIDLYNIFVHEAAHIKHRDIRNRVLLHAFCCIFWWNPIFRLFEKDYSILMEYRCDENAVQSYTLSEKIAYVETMKKMTVVKLDYCYRYMEAGFAIASRKSMLISRADRVFINEKKNIKRIAVAIALEICLFFLSYAVIFQPYYEPEIEGEVAVDETNAYLIKEDDEYRIIIDDEDWGIVPKDDLKTRPYCRLEIRE